MQICVFFPVAATDYSCKLATSKVDGMQNSISAAKLYKFYVGGHSNDINAN